MFINVRKQALLGLCLMAASSLTLTARAANYTPVSGTATSFDKYLIIDKDANVPAASFDFSIAPGEAMAATENSMEVLAGVRTAVDAFVKEAPQFDDLTMLGLKYNGSENTAGTEDKHEGA